MRRWLAIIMLTLLPLQFSWAAVAVYCGHETGKQVQHLGHHEHQHTAQSGVGKDGSSTDKSPAASFDFDCAHCHSYCGSMPPSVGDMAQPTLTSHPMALVKDALRTLAQSPPERPQWQPLA